MTSIHCQRCGASAAPVLVWRGPHVGAYCMACDAWLRWLPQTAETLAEAGARPSAEPSQDDDPQQGTLWGVD